MKKAVLILIVFSVTTVYAQEYINLFKKDLTDRIRYESYAKQLVNKDLDMASKIHPELLYYYITYYNVKYDGKVEKEYRLYDKELGEARSKYIKARNDWFTLGEEHLIAVEKDSNKLAGELEYFLKNNPQKKYSITQLYDSCYMTDINRLDYFVYKYYMQDSDMMYLPNEDYASLRKGYESKVKTSVEEDFRELSNKNLSFGNAEDAYKQLMNFWYLFPDTNKEEPMQAMFTKLIFNDYYKDYLNEKPKITNGTNSETSETYDIAGNAGELKIILGYNNHFIQSLNYNYLPALSTDPQMKNNLNFALNQIFAGLSITLKFSEENKMFSKLILEAGCGINLAEKTLFPHYPENPPPYTGAKDEEFVLAYNPIPGKNNLLIKQILNFSIKAKIPLFYIGNDINLGVGGVADFYTMKYLNNVDFYLVKLWRFVDGFGRVMTFTGGYHKQTINGREETQSFTRFYPLLTAEYKFLRDFSLNCEASLNYYVAGISYKIF